MSVVGVWMWPKSISQYGAEETVRHCKAIGVTDIYFLVKGLAGTVAYPSDIAPSFSERDLLLELLTAAHKHSIRVHAWFTSTCDDHYKRRYPESGRYHYKRGKDRELIALTNEGYLQYMDNILREVFRKYDLDGLHLDYIRYNHLLYGWSEEDLKRYHAEGADTEELKTLLENTFYGSTEQNKDLIFDAYRIGNPSVRALACVRRKDVKRFAERMISAARSVNPDLIVSAAMMPEGAYEDIAFSDLHYGQNYEDAALLYDYVIPMAYSRAYKKDHDWMHLVAQGSINRNLKTVVGVHAYDGGTGPSVCSDINAVSSLPVEGICLFREGAYVCASYEKGQLTIFNPLPSVITHLDVTTVNQDVTLSGPIGTGEEKQYELFFEPKQIRAFSDHQELCIVLSSSIKTAGF